MDNGTLIMLCVNIEDPVNKKKFKELAEEHPGWEFRGDCSFEETKELILPNLTMTCASRIVEWMNTKGIEWSWRASTEPEYFEKLAKIHD